MSFSKRANGETHAEAKADDGGSPAAPGFVERLRQPGYTGENRCLPCTAVNVVIAVVLSVALAYGVTAATGYVEVGGAVGILAFAGSIAAIALRGYLVPYTPTLTKRYFPDSVLRLFDKEASREPMTPPEDIDIEETLVSVGAIEQCENHDDLCLTPSFERMWRDRMKALREVNAETRRETIAEMLELDDDHEIEEFGNAASIVTVDGRQAGQWESDAALIADLAADDLLRNRSDRWAEFSVPARGELLNSLRMFLERCPACDAAVSMGQETVDSCCRSREVVAVTCTDCGSRLFEMEVTPELRAHL